MASRRFRYWSIEELKENVKALEVSRSSGAKSVSYVGGGTIFSIDRKDFDLEINLLYDEIDEREGNANTRPRIRKVLLGYGGKGFR